MISINNMLIIVSAFVLIHQQRHYEVAKRTDFDSEYDFVVVGSGTAGSAVASRLVEAEHRVLLLEAGGPVPVVSKIPALEFELITDNNVIWDYKSVPQKYVGQAYKQHRVAMVRAKVLGGGSVENALNYNRGKVHDFDEWKKEFDLKNWTYNKMLPFLFRSEDLTNVNFARKNRGIHAIGGPMRVSESKLNVIFKKIFKVINESGYSIIDLNDMEGYGLSKMLTNTDAKDGTQKGARWSSEDGFLQPNQNDKNLHILAFARATKLNIQEKSNGKFVVKSVEFFKNNEKHVVKARKEVILSGGVFGSAQLLMLSGIGPKQHLENLGIKSIVDLPVGDNLQDHPAVSIYFRYRQPLKDSESLENFYRFFTNGSGPLNTLSPILLNIRTNVTKNLPKNLPDFEVILYNLKFKDLIESYANNKAWTSYFGSCLNQPCLRVVGKVMYPKSRGTFRLKSKDPFEQPLIDPNYLSQSYDLDVMMAGLKEMFRIFNSKRFQKLATYLGTIPDCNSCSDARFDCDTYLQCLIRQEGRTYQHPLGTCRIGNQNDERRVVDEDFKVRTFDNLRVIDASVIPKIPGGHINVIVGAVGEMGAETVLQKY